MKVTILNSIATEGSKILLENNINSISEVIFNNCDGPLSYLIKDFSGNMRYISLDLFYKSELCIGYKEFIDLFNKLYNDGDFITVKGVNLIANKEELYILEFKRSADMRVNFYGSFWEDSYITSSKLKSGADFGFLTNSSWRFGYIKDSNIILGLSTKEEIEIYKKYYKEPRNKGQSSFHS